LSAKSLTAKIKKTLLAVADFPHEDAGDGKQVATAHKRCAELQIARNWISRSNPKKHFLCRRVRNSYLGLSRLNDMNYALSLAVRTDD
jgi:hypothetical protein